MDQCFEATLGLALAVLLLIVIAFGRSRHMVEPISREDFEKAADEIHLEIGRAITEWSTVEQWLYHIYARLISNGAAGAIPVGLSTSFDKVTRFETRLAMVTALIENSGHPIQFRKAQLASWKPLQKRLRDLNGKRNSVAHGSIVSPQPIMRGAPIAKPVWVPFYEDQGYRLFKLDHAGHGRRSFSELTASDIAGIRKLFVKAVQELAEFFRVNFPQRGV